MNKLIILITTSGCYGCEIIKNILNELIEEENYNIDIKEIDCQNPDYKQFIKDNNITDFPTTLFIENDKVIDKLIGTTCKSNLKMKLSILYNL